MTYDPGTGTARPAGDSASVGQLLGDVTRDLSLLVRQEVELAKAELRQSAKESGKGAGLLGAAGLLGNLALAFLAIAAWWGLGELMNRGWAALIVAVVLAAIAAGLGVTGRNQMKAVTGLPQTTDSVKRIPDAVKGNEGTVR
ncbi:phage holin family protein [Kineosporia sp. J2-2]|uniref:Phage holin family protein n=1 Tax=Kineosporia corallincola TaxID=2835133 RepID=A0ABS5TI85_9ACTN|nr:phage holin family protein [Kineosporia corallincola]MBT0770805.1 phage holin family protein [Kineosporia corallincola]